jgi:hypothetical protein
MRLAEHWVNNRRCSKSALWVIGMKHRQCNRGTGRLWNGEVTDLDRFFAGVDPRQMHFCFYLEPSLSGGDLRQEGTPSAIVDGSPDLLVSTASIPQLVLNKTTHVEIIGGQNCG